MLCHGCGRPPRAPSPCAEVHCSHTLGGTSASPGCASPAHQVTLAALVQALPSLHCRPLPHLAVRLMQGHPLLMLWQQHELCYLLPEVQLQLCLDLKQPHSLLSEVRLQLRRKLKPQQQQPLQGLHARQQLLQRPLAEHPLRLQSPQAAPSSQHHPQTLLRPSAVSPLRSQL